MWRIMEENHFEKCTSTEWPEECHTGPWSKQAVCCFRAASFRFWSLVGPTFPRLRLKKSPIFRGCCVVRHGKSGSNKWGMLQRTIMICHCFVFLGYALLAQVHSETTDLSSTPLSQRDVLGVKLQRHLLKNLWSTLFPVRVGRRCMIEFNCLKNRSLWSQTVTDPFQSFQKYLPRNGWAPGPPEPALNQSFPL